MRSPHRMIFLLGAALLGGLPFSFARGEDRAAFNIPEPWTSRGLSPVVLKPTGGEPFVLLQDGQPACDIVIPAESEYPNYYREVAERLKRFLDEASGASFNIVTDQDLPAERAGLFLGPCDRPFIRNAFETFIPKLPMDGFLTVRFDRGFLLAGRDGPSPVKDLGLLRMDSTRHLRGTFFAVCDFLERLLGFRFYFPGRLGMHIPEYRNQTVVLPAVAYTDAPVFPLRLSSYAGYETLDIDLLGATRPERILWDRMLRTGDPELQYFGHTDQGWHELYAKSHPEFFALRPDGTRSIRDRGPHSMQLCYTEPGLLQEHLRLIERADRGESIPQVFSGPYNHPNESYIYWWPNDGYRGCACDGCMALSDPQAAYYARHSRLIWDYILRLSAAVRERWPGKTLKVPVYSSYGSIPENIEVPDNVALNVVRFGRGRFPAAYFKEPAYFQSALDEVAEFNRRSKQKIWVWVHYPHSPRIRNGLMAPYPIPHFMQRYMAANRDSLCGLYLNGHFTSSWAMDGLMVYFWYKLLWNPDLDVDAVVEEYARTLWGPAHPQILEFTRTLIDRWEKVRWKDLPAPDQFDFDIPSELAFTETYPGPVREQLRKNLQQAVLLSPENSLYRDRALYFQAAHRSFFESGENLDLRNIRRAEAIRLTPNRDGELGEWPEGNDLRLVQNPGGGEPGLSSRFRVAHDDQALYILGDLEIGSDVAEARFPAGEGRDRELWEQDSVEIYLSPDRDGLREAGLPVTEQIVRLVLDFHGNVYDAIASGGARVFDSRVDLKGQVSIRNEAGRLGFELRLPLAELKARIHPDTDWRLNLFRHVHPREGKPEVHAWSTAGRLDDATRFGVLRFDYPLLWESDFSERDTLEPETRLPPEIAEKIQFTVTRENGICRIRVQTAPDFQRREFKLQVTPRIPNRPATGHAVLEWEYRVLGKGLEQLRSYGAHSGGPGGQLANYISRYPAPGTDWHTLLQDKVREGQTLPVINYFTIALTPEPGADVTLEVRRIAVYDRKSPEF
ncbi:MAG: DUF4838 domain-containing protein [Kiritimatiellia bacterium]|nr:DUF4838 domain-containing protein [Kiritimatiellia bacterium]